MTYGLNKVGARTRKHQKEQSGSRSRSRVVYSSLCIGYNFPPWVHDFKWCIIFFYMHYWADSGAQIQVVQSSFPNVLLGKSWCTVSGGAEKSSIEGAQFQVVRYSLLWRVHGFRWCGRVFYRGCTISSGAV